MGTIVLICPDVNRRRMEGGRSLRPTTPPRRICRRLFQDGPPTQSRISTLSALQQEGEKDSVTKWNFDFRAGVPLPGRYNWVPVHPKRDSATSAVAEESPLSQPTKQSKITDFMKKRKLTDSTPDLSSSKCRRKLDSCGFT